jgi:diguanylate cyclase (GGDEF)-like protein
MHRFLARTNKERAVFDIQTFMLALGIGNIGLAVLMAGYTHGVAVHPGLRLWMWARLGLGLIQLLGWLRPLLGMPWLEAVVPVGWVAGISLEVAAYCVFFNFHRWRRVLYPATAAALVVVASAHSAGASVGELTTLISVIIALFAAAMSVILLRPRKRGSSPLQRLIGANDALFAIAMGVWAWVGVESAPVRAFAYLAGYLLMIVNGFGFLLLWKQKDDARIELLATTDFLTGLVNRRAFFARAESARMLAARLRKPITLMMLDIDHFKQLNDRFGHATGDQALVVFADTARKVLREHDIMGRLGGEEFALALPGTDLDGAVQAAERLRLAVTEAPLPASAQTYTMTVSIGVVLVDPTEELTAALARADHALYAAKSGGRNRVELGAPVLKRA